MSSPAQASTLTYDPKVLLSIALGEPGPRPGSAFTAPEPAELDGVFPGLRVESLLGQGGMGAVYRATQVNLDRPVALKVLPPHLSQDAAWVSRFQREAKALARLSHPHLVTVHDVGCAGGWNYLVMEFVDGATLRQVLRSGRLGPAEVLALVPQLCDALQYAHDHGVIHRDLKPENILIDGRGRAKIADFGLAKLLGQEPADAGLTASGVVMGTLHYMAPEQVEGAKHVDHRADIYSLGVVVYEMLTGGLPLGRFDPPSRRIIIDARVDEVVLRSLEKEPDRRWQQASEVQQRLAPVSAVSAGTTPGAPPRPPTVLGWLLVLGSVPIGLWAFAAALGGAANGPERTIALLGTIAAPFALWGGWCLRGPRSATAILIGLGAWGVLLLSLLGVSSQRPGGALLLVAITAIAAWPLRGSRLGSLLAAAGDHPAPWPRWYRWLVLALWVLAGLAFTGNLGR